MATALRLEPKPDAYIRGRMWSCEISNLYLELAGVLSADTSWPARPKGGNCEGGKLFRWQKRLVDDVQEWGQ